MTTFRFGKQHWREFGEKEYEIIKKERQERNEILSKSDRTKGMWGKECPACEKPNTINVDFCTGCGFTLTDDDVVKLPDNIFLDIITGKYTKTKILYRDEKYLVFDDKFGVSKNHLDVIPVKVIEDITKLTEKHIPLLEDLFRLGIEEFKRRNIKEFEGKNLEDLVVAGYNFPVSVKHLHLHLVLPPFKHRKVFQYPRWHSHKKVVSDLKKHGRVITYEEKPNDKEGEEEYNRAMQLHDQYCNTIETKLLVVGDVTTNSARILYEAYDEEPNSSVSIKIVDASSNQQVENIKHPASVTLKNKPQILVLNELQPNKRYRVYFGEEDYVSFKTFSDKLKSLKIVTVSCNRYYEDQDDEYLKHLLEKNPERDLVIHIGDQVYADRVFTNTSLTSYDQILEGYRNVYRTTWGNPAMQKILRNNANWMLPDDHDIINNLDREFLEGPSKQAVMAGRQAFYEYQFQLMNDIYNEDGTENEIMKNNEIYSFKKISGIGFALLDLRFQRTFHFEKDSPLFGKKQFTALKETLKEWDKSVDSIYIFTGVPFVFFSPIMSRIVYKMEKERYLTLEEMLPETLKFLEAIRPYSSKVRLVAGDLHQFVMSDICHKVTGECIPQMITSGITKGSTSVGEVKLWAFYTFGSYFTNKDIGDWKLKVSQNFLGRNYGVIEHEEGKINWYGMVDAELHDLKSKILQLAFDRFDLIVKLFIAYIVIVIFYVFF